MSFHSTRGPTFTREATSTPAHDNAAFDGSEWSIVGSNGEEVSPMADLEPLLVDAELWMYVERVHRHRLARMRADLAVDLVPVSAGCNQKVYVQAQTETTDFSNLRLAHSQLARLYHDALQRAVRTTLPLPEGPAVSRADIEMVLAEVQSMYTHMVIQHSGQNVIFLGDEELIKKAISDFNTLYYKPTPNNNPYTDEPSHSVPHPEAHSGQIESSNTEKKYTEQSQIVSSTKLTSNSSKEQIIKYETTTEKPGESTDRIVQLIMTADEYIGHMDILDNKIHAFAKSPPQAKINKKPSVMNKMLSWMAASEPEETEEEQHERELKVITKLLGIRGHLQGELYRIEIMLTKDDAKLKCLEEFEQTFPGVVATIQHNFKARQHHTVDLDSLPLLSQAQDDLMKQAMERSLQKTLEADVNSLESGSSYHVDPKVTRNELKKAHLEEREKLAQTYAMELAARRQYSLSSTDVNKLLADHARSVEALWARQNTQRKTLVQLQRAFSTEHESLRGETASVSQYSQPFAGHATNEISTSSRSSHRPTVSSVSSKGTANIAKSVVPMTSELKEKHYEHSVYSSLNNTVQDALSKTKSSIMANMGKWAWGETQKDLKTVPVLNTTIDNKHEISCTKRDTPSINHHSSNGAYDKQNVKIEPVKHNASQLKCDVPSSKSESSMLKTATDSGATDNIVLQNSSVIDRDSTGKAMVSLSNAMSKTDAKQNSDITNSNVTNESTLQSVATKSLTSECSESANELVCKPLQKTKIISSQEHFTNEHANIKQDERQELHLDEHDSYRHDENVSNVMDDSLEEDNSDDDDVDSIDDDPVYAEIHKELMGKDSKFVQVVHQQEDVTDEMYMSLLRQHIIDTDNLRKQKLQEASKLNDQLREKLKARKSTESSDASDEIDDDLDDIIEEASSELVQEFAEKLSAQRQELTSEEVEILLEDHRREKIKLAHRLKAEQERHEERARLMLEKRRKRQSNSSQPEESFAVIADDEHLEENDNTEFEHILNLYKPQLSSDTAQADLWWDSWDTSKGAIKYTDSLDAELSFSIIDEHVEE